MSLQTRIERLEETRRALLRASSEVSHPAHALLLVLGDEMLTLLRERRQEEIEDLEGSRG